jgi:hypothetical protein
MKSIADLGRISKRTCYKYISVLRRENLIYDHGDNMCLRSNKSINKEFPTRIISSITLKNSDS